MTHIFTSLQLTDILVNESHYTILTDWERRPIWAFTVTFCAGVQISTPGPDMHRLSVLVASVKESFATHKVPG